MRAFSQLRQHSSTTVSKICDALLHSATMSVPASAFVIASSAEMAASEPGAGNEAFNSVIGRKLHSLLYVSAMLLQHLPEVTENTRFWVQELMTTICQDKAVARSAARASSHFRSVVSDLGWSQLSSMCSTIPSKAFLVDLIGGVSSAEKRAMSIRAMELRASESRDFLQFWQEHIVHSELELQNNDLRTSWPQNLDQQNESFVSQLRTCLRAIDVAEAEGKTFTVSHVVQAVEGFKEACDAFNYTWTSPHAFKNVEALPHALNAAATAWERSEPPLTDKCIRFALLFLPHGRDAPKRLCLSALQYALREGENSIGGKVRTENRRAEQLNLRDDWAVPDDMAAPVPLEVLLFERPHTSWPSYLSLVMSLASTLEGVKALDALGIDRNCINFLAYNQLLADGPALLRSVLKSAFTRSKMTNMKEDFFEVPRPKIPLNAEVAKKFTDLYRASLMLDDLPIEVYDPNDDRGCPLQMLQLRKQLVSYYNKAVKLERDGRFPPVTHLLQCVPVLQKDFRLLGLRESYFYEPDDLQLLKERFAQLDPAAISSHEMLSLRRVALLKFLTGKYAVKRFCQAALHDLSPAPRYPTSDYGSLSSVPSGSFAGTPPSEFADEPSPFAFTTPSTQDVPELGGVQPLFSVSSDLTLAAHSTATAAPVSVRDGHSSNRMMFPPPERSSVIGSAFRAGPSDGFGRKKSSTESIFARQCQRPTVIILNPKRPDASILTNRIPTAPQQNGHQNGHDWQTMLYRQPSQGPVWDEKLVGVPPGVSDMTRYRQVGPVPPNEESRFEGSQAGPSVSLSSFSDRLEGRLTNLMPSQSSCFDFSAAYEKGQPVSLPVHPEVIGGHSLPYLAHFENGQLLNVGASGHQLPLEDARIPSEPAFVPLNDPLSTQMDCRMGSATYSQASVSAGAINIQPSPPRLLETPDGLLEPDDIDMLYKCLDTSGQYGDISSDAFPNCWQPNEANAASSQLTVVESASQSLHETSAFEADPLAHGLTHQAGGNTSFTAGKIDWSAVLTSTLACDWLSANNQT